MAVPDHPWENFYPDDEAADRLAAKERAPLEEMPTSTFTSSNVHSGLYDFGERELFMRYLRDGEPDAIYRYDNLGAQEWQGLKQAVSKGSYINANVAFEYNYTKLNASDLPDEGRGASDQRVRRFVTTP
jgi:hypothetical protein